MKFRTVTPVFQVADLARAIGFYRDVLGFDVAWQWGEPPHIASVCSDPIEIVLLVAAQPAVSSAIINMGGVDEYFARVVKAGAREIVPLADRLYGMRDGRIADIDGNQLTLGQPLEAAAS
jgi:uncharacterized glyoxalase superfamily protein PhnB